MKPHNFAMGLGSNMDIVHMFDYSSARPYLCLPDMSEHIPFSSTGRRAIGTVRYASLVAHKSHCTCIHIVRHRVSHIAHVRPSDSCLPRRRYRVPPLRSPRVLPRPSPAAYRAHVAGLAYGEEPDYALLRGLFQNRMAHEGWAYNWVYDWMDARRLPKGTLLPEEYKASFGFVEDKEYNPHLM